VLLLAPLSGHSNEQNVAVGICTNPTEFIQLIKVTINAFFLTKTLKLFSSIMDAMS
jgi:hypothetical protein